MKRLLLLLSLLLAASTVHSQDLNTAHLSAAWNLNSTTFVYPRLLGMNTSPFGQPILGPAPIKTTGSSVSVTEATAGTNPFLELLAGDVLLVRRPSGLVDLRVIDVRTDAANVTIDTAVDWSAPGFFFSWLKFSQLATDADGWVDVSKFTAGASLVFQYDQGDFATAVEAEFECRSQGLEQKPVIICPRSATDTCCGPGTVSTGVCRFTAAGIAARTSVSVPYGAGWSSCRVAVRGVGADTSDVGAARERITVSVQGTLAH